MDNCAFSSNTQEYLHWAYSKLNDIFYPYKFQLQQFITNFIPLQQVVDENTEEKIEKNTKLLGMMWNREADTISAQRLKLDSSASTKREILRSIASNFDPFNISGPLLNRAKIFMHDLQCTKGLDWDSKLTDKQCGDWRNIAKQVNNAKELHIQRFIGKREEIYKLLAFVDSSKRIYGTVIYLQNVVTKKVNFIAAKNKMVGKGLLLLLCAIVCACFHI